MRDRILVGFLSFAFAGGAFGAWYDNPTVRAKVERPTAADPHYMNLSEDGQYLLLDLNAANNPARKTLVYRTDILAAARGASLPLQTVDQTLAGSKGGALSAARGVMIPGFGTASGLGYRAYSLTDRADAGTALDSLTATGLVLDGLDFNADGTRIYSNSYADGTRGNLVIFDAADLANITLSKTVATGLARVRSVNAYSIKGKDLVYFGEGGIVEEGGSGEIAVYDAVADQVSVVVADAARFTADVMCVKVSCTRTAMPMMYVLLNDGRLFVYALRADGKSVCSATPVREFTSNQVAAFCGVAKTSKYRNFEVLDDDSLAFFTTTGAAPLTVVGAPVAAGDDPCIEFTGDQSIDTSVPFGPDTAVVADYAFVDTSTVQQFVWEGSDGSTVTTRIYVNGNKGYSFAANDTGTGNWQTFDVALSTTRYVGIVDAFNNRARLLDAQGNVVANQDAKIKTQTHNNTSKQTIKIGSSSWMTGNFAKMKLYGFRLYEKDVLVRDYIPAQRDGEIGLWDRVSKTFTIRAIHQKDKVNTYGEPFASHGTLAEIANDPYIESNGTSGINTGVYCQPGLKVEVDYQFTDVSDPAPESTSHYQQRLVATDSDDKYPRLSVYINNSQNIALTSGDGWNSPNSTDIKADLVRHTVVLDSVAKLSSFITGGTTNKTIASQAFTKWSTRQIGLMAGVNNLHGNTFANKSKVRIYSAKFWVDGELIRSFEPRIVNGVAGFEETVKGGFYTCDGLTASADVSSEMTGPGYVESDGSLYSTINTHYFVNPKTRIEVDYQQVVNNTSKIIFGAYNDNTVCTLLFENGSGFMMPTIKDGNYVGPTLSPQRGWDLACHKAVLDASTGYQALFGQEGNIETEGSNTSVTKTAGRPFAFFGTSTSKAGKSDQRSKARIFRAKFFEKEGDDYVLVHDFKPVSQDGIPGLLDEKTGEFFSGGNITGGGKLPEVAGDAYIESPYGNRSMDTGYYVSAQTAIVCDYMPLVQQNNQQFPFEAGDSTHNAVDQGDQMYMRMYGNGSTGEGDWSYAFGRSGFTSTSVPYSPHVRRLLTMDGPNMKLKIESAGGVDCDLTIASTAPCGNKSGTTLKLFANYNGTGNVAKGRLYGFKIYEAGKLVRDYKPVVLPDGFTGLKDEETGQVVGWMIASMATPPVECGGPIEVLDQDRGTLYLEGDGSRTVNTGYKAKGNSRIEVDFSYTSTDGSKVLCGVWTPSTASDALLRYAPWHETRATKVIFGYQKTPQRTDWPSADVNRHTFVIDFKNKKLQYNTANSTNEQMFSTDVGWSDSTVCNIPMGVFGTFKDVNATVSDTMRAAARIYGIKIYEDNKLVHEFAPAMDGDAATLYDLVDETYASVVKFADGAALKIGGKAADGASFAADLPEGESVDVDAVKTLNVVVPGAVAYQWYRNGVAIEGETASSLDIAWAKRTPPAIYVCEAFFDVNGATESSVSSPCTVSMKKRGAAIIIR